VTDDPYFQATYQRFKTTEFKKIIKFYRNKNAANLWHQISSKSLSIL